MIRLGVTGTDTGVGKTTLCSALAVLLRTRGLRVEAMKPVETGIAPNDIRTDARCLRAAAHSTAPMADVGPMALDEPLAPWMAARRAGRPLTLPLLDAAFEQLERRSDAIVVEGAGGVLVPITLTENFLTLFTRWRLDVIIVAANRLGAINHTLLTVRAVCGAGLRLRGVVLNDLEPGPPDVARATNHEALCELLAGTPVVSFPWLAAPDDEACVARAARQSALAPLCNEQPNTEPIEDDHYR